MEHSKDKQKIFPADPQKTYGLMALVKGKSSLKDKEPEDTEFTFPHLIYREAVFFMCLVLVLALISVFFNAPLEELANPSKTPNPAKAPWYFLGIQELLHYFPPFIAGVLLPGLVVFALILLPYLDYHPKGSGTWFSRERKIINLIFGVFVLIIVVLTIIGKFFRGPGWSWVWPWH